MFSNICKSMSRNSSPASDKTVTNEWHPELKALENDELYSSVTKGFRKYEERLLHHATALYGRYNLSTISDGFKNVQRGLHQAQRELHELVTRENQANRPYSKALKLAIDETRQVNNSCERFLDHLEGNIRIVDGREINVSGDKIDEDDKRIAEFIASHHPTTTSASLDQMTTHSMARALPAPRSSSRSSQTRIPSNQVRPTASLSPSARHTSAARHSSQAQPSPRTSRSDTGQSSSRSRQDASPNPRRTPQSNVSAKRILDSSHDS